MAAARIVKLTELLEDPNNPRKVFGDLGELVSSIKTHGVIEPILVRETPKGLMIVAGGRRFRAAREARRKEVPVLVKDLTPAEALELQLVENVQREDLHPMEEAEAYGRLVSEFGYPVDKVAERVGKTPSVVYARLKLLDLVPAARKVFVSGDLLASTALLVARLKGERLQLAALSLVSQRNRWGDLMQAREAEAVIRRLKAQEEAVTRREATRVSGERAVKATIRRIRSYAMGRIVENVEHRQELAPQDLRLVLAALTADGAPQGLLERREVKDAKQLTARAQKMSGAELRGLLVETALTSWVDEEAEDAHHRLKAAVKAFGLEFAELEKTVRQLQAKEAQAAEAEALFKK